MRLRQVGPRDDLWRARIAHIDRCEVLWRALMGEPQNTAPILGDLDRHALADPAEPVEFVMSQLFKIPNRRVRHLSTPFETCRDDRITHRGRPSSAKLDDPSNAHILRWQGVCYAVRFAVFSRCQARSEIRCGLLSRCALSCR